MQLITRNRLSALLCTQDTPYKTNVNVSLTSNKFRTQDSHPEITIYISLHEK